MKLRRPTRNVDLGYTKRLDDWIAEKLAPRPEDDPSLPFMVRFAHLYNARTWAMSQRRRFWNRLRAMSYQDDQQ